MIKANFHSYYHWPLKLFGTSFTLYIYIYTFLIPKKKRKIMKIDKYIIFWFTWTHLDQNRKSTKSYIGTILPISPEPIRYFSKLTWKSKILVLGQIIRMFYTRCETVWYQANKTNLFFLFSQNNWINLVIFG